MNAFDDRSRADLSLWDTTNACRTLVVHILNMNEHICLGKEQMATYPCLNTPQATQFLVTCLFPFGDQAAGM